MPDTGAHARTEAHKDAIRRLYKALEAGDVDVADELFTDDFVTSEGRHQNVRGPQGFKDAIRGCTAPTPTPRSRSWTWWPRATR